ncbi:kynureninase [Luteitalea sp. TBR-22]|uniref:aminotransferase class V-fold PLP-dependent enzyme n=1 Tax=Luteitalea sp. TBR-22 TaxID=2802971 RepID=UPI001AF6DD9A|nr:aminotransferase class V-fold PLP-dependent enzyme [Luteitalea sp. TBR-22]BCS34381.1 kynureninase [Luteitalea sp. TBR-22]
MTDPLLRWRAEFPILDTCTYLVSHSLGAMPRAARAQADAFLDAWASRGVRAWSEGWWETSRQTGDLLAPLLGVPAGTVTMVQNVSVAQSAIVSSLDFTGPRRRLVVAELDFPTNQYVFEGWRRHGAEVVYVPSPDGLTQPVEPWLSRIDERTALVCCSLVLFRSSAITDVRPIIERAHAVGARVVLDVYQATGTVPLDLTSLDVDFAVGGSVKWLCGGPGAGYLYARPDVAAAVVPAATGWAAHARPFAFETGALDPAEGEARFASGTPNVSAWMIAQAGYRIVNEVGVEAIRARSLRQTRRIMDHAAARGWRVRTPQDDAWRGGTVTLDVPDSARVAADLLARGVIIDHRPNAGIRMAPHFYTTDEEIDAALAVMDDLVHAS